MISLPKAPIPVTYSIDKYNWLIYGPPGSGKSTFAAEFPNAFFFPFEEGLCGIETRRPLDGKGNPFQITTWEQFLEVVESLKAAPGYAKYAVIDTVDYMYAAGMQYFCRKSKVTHPSELEYGRGYDGVKTTILDGLFQLMSAGTRIIFISHAKEKQVEIRGVKRDRTMSTLTDHARGIFHNMTDIIAYMGYKSVFDPVSKRMRTQRIFTTEPNELLEVKDRTKGKMRGEIVLSDITAQDYAPGSNYTILKNYFEGVQK